MNELERKRKANMIAVIMTTTGILFFIAMAFGVLQFKYAMFFGVACFILATMTRRLMKQEN
jgi:hypothetical protein